MKIIALNGSPRKKFSCGPMLESFVNGVHYINNNIEVKYINIYDYNFKGCMSCLNCKIKNNPNHCMIKDDIQELLIEIRDCDAFVFASPIYYFDLSGELRSFFERLMYPGPVNKSIPIIAIYSMNANENEMLVSFRKHIDDIEMFLKHCFHSDIQELFAFNSLQRLGDDDLYKPSRSNHVEKRNRRNNEFPKDLKKAYSLGKSVARKLEEERI